MSFGQELQRKREKNGLSLEAIAASTKISTRHLRALEDGSWNDLPGGVFTRGIVRNYCRVVGLNESEWMERLAASVPAAAEQEVDWSEFAENVKRNRAVGHDQVRHRWWGVLVMGAGLCLLGLGVWQFVVVPRVQARPLPTLHGLLSQRK